MAELQNDRSRGNRPHVDCPRYLVVGRHRVHGTPSGGTFSLPLSADHERYLIEAGHIQIVEPARPDSNSADSADKEQDNAD